MRYISTAVKTLLELNAIIPFYLVSVGTTLKHTSLTQDLSVNGVTYLGDNKLVAIQPPRLSSVVDREAYSIIYADPDFELRPLFEAGFSGSLITVSIGFFNISGGTLGGVAPGEPMTNPDDIIISYQGTVDSQTYSVNFDGAVTAGIEGSSPMGALEMTKGFYTSKNNMRERNPNDTSFDEIYEGSKGIALRWGKI
jgi:hypothetical protein